MKRGVVIYQNWAPLLRRLPAPLRGEVVLLVLDYSETGEQNFTGDPAADMLLSMMYAQVGEDLNKYQELCERNAANAKSRYERMQSQANASERMQSHAIATNKKENKNINKEKDTHTINSVRIEKESAATAVAPTRAQTRYERFLDWLKAECPYIAAHYKLPSEELFTKLLDKYGGEAIAEQCANIENRADIRKRYTNLYQTLNNWLKRETNGNNKDDNAESSREQRAAAVADLITRLRAEDARAG